MSGRLRYLLGLHRCGAFYRDRPFLLALLAGGGVWLLLWANAPTRPLPWQHLASWRFVSLVVWWPGWEELLFRGLLQGLAAQYAWGQRSWGGISGANAGVSLLFMSIHWWAHPPLWAVAVFWPSLLFGWMRDRYGSVYPAMVLHMVYNAGYFWLSGLVASL